MGNKAIEFKIEKYVGEKSTELANCINRGGNLLIQAPTGSGKSYAFIEYGKTQPHKRIIFCCPTQTLVDNLGSSANAKGIPFGYGLEFINSIKEKNFIITTYDSIRLLENIDILFIDEAHLLAGHSGFREVLVDLLKFESQRVLISATPEIIENLPNYQRINFKHKKKSSPKHVDIVRSIQSPLQIARNILMNLNLNGDKLIIIRLNNKNHLQKIYDWLKPIYGDSLAMYYSSKILTEFQDPELIYQLRKGEVPIQIKILLCTSIFDAGLSLRVKREVDCYAISNNKNRMPNAIDMIQLRNRVRSKQGVMKQTIIGEFGELTIEDLSTSKFSSPNERIWLSHANTQYDLYRDLDRDGYIGLLDYYGLRANEIKESRFIKKATAIGSNISAIQIAKNLTNFPKVYGEISERCKHLNNGDWLNSINGTQFISYNTIPVKVFDIRNQLINALKHDLHFSLFIDNFYHEQRVNLLNNAISEYNNSEFFRQVLDDLVDGVEIGFNCVFKMSLEDYHPLNEHQKKMIKEVSKLLYEGREWRINRKTIKLTRLKDNPLVNNYINTFKNGIDDIWCLS